MKRDHRLRIIDAQTVSFAPKTPWSDGTTHVLLSPEELIEKLEALVPPPRLNLVRAIMVFWRPTPLIGADRTRFEGGREPRFGQWRTHCPAAMLSFELGSTFCPSVSYRGDALSRLPRPHEAHCSNYLLCPLSALVVVVENLRVADAGIMLECGRANSNLSTMAIGEWVADFILET